MTQLYRTLEGSTEPPAIDTDRKADKRIARGSEPTALETIL
ncbi:hypothetical protein [Natrinema sp. CBA1119]|nr:hypothetical protein [Natrinema sp. CBA1119]